MKLSLRAKSPKRFLSDEYCPTCGKKKSWNKGRKNPKHKLTSESVEEIRSMKKVGCNSKTIAKIYGIHPANVDRIKNHVYWRESP